MNPNHMGDPYNNPYFRSYVAPRIILRYLLMDYFQPPLPKAVQADFSLSRKASVDKKAAYLNPAKNGYRPKKGK